jgi:hypothetical protein
MRECFENKWFYMKYGSRTKAPLGQKLHDKKPPNNDEK